MWCGFSVPGRCAWTLALCVAGLSAAASVKPPPETAGVVAPSATVAPPIHRPYHQTHPADGEKAYYAAAWGVDHLRVRLTSSDNLVKFTYRVVDPQRAAPLGDHAATPEMVALRAGMVLSVQTMEKIGQLRQATAREAGKEYWMVFSNKGQPVRTGDRVNVVIGKFSALGLLVE